MINFRFILIFKGNFLHNNYNETFYLRVLFTLLENISHFLINGDLSEEHAYVLNLKIFIMLINFDPRFLMLLKSL